MPDEEKPPSTTSESVALIRELPAPWRRWAALALVCVAVIAGASFAYSKLHTDDGAKASGPLVGTISGKVDSLQIGSGNTMVVQSPSARDQNGVLLLAVSPNTTICKVDGVEKSPPYDAIFVVEGTHTVECSAPGYDTFTAKIPVGPYQRKNVDVSLLMVGVHPVISGPVRIGNVDFDLIAVTYEQASHKLYLFPKFNRSQPPPNLEITLFNGSDQIGRIVQPIDASPEPTLELVMYVDPFRSEGTVFIVGFRACKDTCMGGEATAYVLTFPYALH